MSSYCFSLIESLHCVEELESWQWLMQLAFIASGETSLTSLVWTCDCNFQSLSSLRLQEGTWQWLSDYLMCFYWVPRLLPLSSTFVCFYRQACLDGHLNRAFVSLNPPESPSERCLDLGSVLLFLCLLKGQWEPWTGTTAGHDERLWNLIHHSQILDFRPFSVRRSCTFAETTG